MKKLRILFLAVLATALVVSGAFVAETLPTASFDKKITVNNGTAGSVTSIDVVSPDATTAVVKFDFSAYSKDYTISISEDVAGFEVESDDGVWTVSFNAAKTTEKGLTSKDYKISFKFVEKGKDDKGDDTGDAWTAEKKGDGRKYKWKDTAGVSSTVAGTYWKVTATAEEGTGDSTKTFTPAAGTAYLKNTTEGNKWEFVEGTAEVTIATGST